MIYVQFEKSCNADSMGYIFQVLQFIREN